MISFFGCILSFLAFMGLSHQFSLEGLIWFLIGVAMIGHRVVGSLLIAEGKKEINNDK